MRKHGDTYTDKQAAAEQLASSALHSFPPSVQVAEATRAEKEGRRPGALQRSAESDLLMGAGSDEDGSEAEGGESDEEEEELDEEEVSQILVIAMRG